MSNLKEKEYLTDLKRIKKLIKENSTTSIIVVNSTMILTYYQIGQIINSRNSWGSNYIRKLSNDLNCYGANFTYEYLKKMARFACQFSEEDLVTYNIVKIAWGSLLQIINKSKSKEEMIWYITQTYKNKWSRSTILRQFEAQAYQRGIIEPQTSNEGYIQEIVKDSLAFPFISNNEIASEKDLKNKLMDNVVLFLQELGPGFALVGKEFRLVTPSNKNFYIDLLMYHVVIHAFIVIEVKLNEIEPGDFGQLNFYINAVNDLLKKDLDSDTAGILLCKGGDNYVIKTSLEGLKNPIGVSKYKLLEDLPAYLEKKLKELE